MRAFLTLRFEYNTFLEFCIPGGQDVCFVLRYAWQGECDMQKMVPESLPEYFVIPPSMKLYPDLPR
jgi:hypothetical protein